MADSFDGDVAFETSDDVQVLSSFEDFGLKDVLSAHMLCELYILLGFTPRGLRIRV